MEKGLTQKQLRSDEYSVFHKSVLVIHTKFNVTFAQDYGICLQCKKKILLKVHK